MATDIERWLKSQNPDIVNSMDIVSVARPLVHISNNANIRRFVPRIPFSTYDGEDRTVPRVCVGISIVEAMLGLGREFMEFSSSTRGHQFRYTLYGIDTELAIRPTKKLTKEHRANGELWVVPYQAALFDITPKRLGQLTVTDITPSDESAIIGFVLEVKEDIQFTPTRLLKPGHYKVSGVSLRNIKNNDRDLSYDITEITQNMYDTGAKNCNVSVMR